ncbi:kinesin-like protein KIN-4C [Senna tora]|uniref:Kinesin-like protein KIN-4C n=1 Tax=Senna tora TaxID=362788 RepID=A0A834SWL8_9FABA|nr:kinesin-like protein KIN-4C [Senna tora]
MVEGFDSSWIKEQQEHNMLLILCFFLFFAIIWTASFTCDNEYSSDSDAKAVDVSDGIEDHAKELEHSSLQEKLDKELKELDEKLEQKGEIEELRCNLASISSTSDDGAQKLKQIIFKVECSGGIDVRHRAFVAA